MARQVDVDALHVLEHRADGIGVVVVEPPAHVADHDHRVHLLGANLADGGLQRLDRIERHDAAERLGREPKGEAGRDQADEADPEAPHLANRPGLHLVPGAGEAAGPLSAPLEIRRQHR